MRFEGDVLSVQGVAQVWPLRSYRRVYVLALGKAAFPMAKGIWQLLGNSIEHMLIITVSPCPRLPNSEVWIGDHPIPGERSLRAGERLKEFLQEASADDLLLVLLSGGGSALATLPPPTRSIPSPSLEDLQRMHEALLSCGATIGEINTLRRHLDPLKGGGLLRLCRASTLTLALSDVIGNAPEAIASGPTVADPTTLAEAWNVIERYQLRLRLPASIRKALEEAAETLKPGDPLLQPQADGRARHVYHIIGDNRLAAQAALRAARRHGFHAALLTTTLRGEASQAGRFLAAILRQIAESGDPLPRPACLIAAGETTVTLHGQGLGGRNQELALAAALEIINVPDVALIAMATDGRDGPTDAAGAVVNGNTVQRAAARGLDALRFLEAQDSYTFFAALGDTLHLPSGRTNVNDLIFLFAF
uniref:Hydroxypyruvate reductase n=1 Tax=uncultured prokaryote TaxID=198431 RepID=H5SM06_9ZZZZ|nr:hydroxypyruvate reductase [uncultured prokaryote]